MLAGPSYCPLLQKKADFCETAISASCKIDVGTAGRALFGQHRVLANIKEKAQNMKKECNTFINISCLCWIDVVSFRFYLDSTHFLQAKPKISPMVMLTSKQKKPFVENCTG